MNEHINPIPHCTFQFISCTGLNFTKPVQAVQVKYELNEAVRQMNDPLIVKFMRLFSKGAWDAPPPRLYIHS